MVGTTLHGEGGDRVETGDGERKGPAHSTVGQQNTDIIILLHGFVGEGLLGKVGGVV